MYYSDRHNAGIILANQLSAYQNKKETIVLALPRGGVPVAYEIATSLHLPLDVFIVRKLGVPGHEELAMGAIAAGDVSIFNENILHEFQVTPEEIAAVKLKEQKELRRRESVYRGNHTFPVLRDKTVILVDDGIATGATMTAAITALKKLNVKKIIIAVPVADQTICETLAKKVEEVICPFMPNPLQAVGSWYEDFTQTEDEEVHQLLKQAKIELNKEK